MERRMDGGNRSTDDVLEKGAAHAGPLFITMRPNVPVVFSEKLSGTAYYVGLLSPRILVAYDLKWRLTEWELMAVINHERAHRNLWHVELNFLCSILILSSAIVVALHAPWWAILFLVLGSIVLRGLRFCQELEADAAADPRDMHSALLKLHETPPPLSIRIRLRRLSRSLTA